MSFLSGTRVRSVRDGHAGTVVDAKTVQCLLCSGKGSHEFFVVDGQRRVTPCDECAGQGFVTFASYLEDPIKAARGPLMVVRFDDETAARAFYEDAFREFSAPELLAEIPT